LRGGLGFGGAVGLPLLALVIPVKILAPAWRLVGIVSAAKQAFFVKLKSCSTASPICRCW
jgi:hypothetical protein